MLALAGILPACAGTPATPTGAGPVPVPPTPGTGLPRPVTLAAAVEAARADAARRHGVEPAAVEQVSAEDVTWADGSLGCPRPDLAYTMALEPGFRVRLRVRGAVLDYHASARGALLLCPPGMAVEPLPARSRL